MRNCFYVGNIIQRFVLLLVCNVLLAACDSSLWSYPPPGAGVQRPESHPTLMQDAALQNGEEKTASPMPPRLPTEQGLEIAPVPVRGTAGAWSFITMPDGLCSWSPRFRVHKGQLSVLSETEAFCWYDAGLGWQTLYASQGTYINDVDRFSAGEGWWAAIENGVCNLGNDSQWRCFYPRSGFTTAQMLQIAREDTFMSSTQVEHLGRLYSIPDLVGATQARTTAIEIAEYGYSFLIQRAWIGTNGYGIVVIEQDGSTSRYTMENGLPGNSIRAISIPSCPDLCPAESTWVATDRGVAHWDGSRFQTHTAADGLPSDDVTGVSAYDEDTVWIVTGQGAARFDGRAWRVFGKAQGQPDVQLTGVYSWRHDVWFSTLGQGILALNPGPEGLVKGSGDFPHLRLMGFLSDGKQYALYDVKGDTATPLTIFEESFENSLITLQSSPDNRYDIVLTKYTSENATRLEVFDAETNQRVLIDRGMGRMPNGQAEIITSAIWKDDTHILYNRVIYPSNEEMQKLSYGDTIPVKGEIWLGSVDGKERQQIASGAFYKIIGVSSTGKTLYVTRLIEDAWPFEGFALLNIDTSTTDYLWPAGEKPEEHYYNLQMVTLPDGTHRVRYTQGLPGVPTVWIGDPETRQSEILLTGTEIGPLAPENFLFPTYQEQMFAYTFNGSLWLSDTNQDSERLLGENVGTLLNWTDKGIVAWNEDKGVLQLFSITGQLLGEIQFYPQRIHLQIPD